MNYIQGTNREQIVLYTNSLDNIIDKNNEVRDIDKFVNSLNIKSLGFISEKQITGRPAYNPADLLKLYIYSYMNRTRSSREIEKDTKRNIEVIWLVKGLQPDHNTISNFRKNNSEPIRKVFEVTVKVAKNRDLIGGRLIAGDSVKLRAQNSKKNNFNKEKLENQIDYLNRKIEEYNQLLDSEDFKNEKPKSEEKTIDPNNKPQIINNVEPEYLEDKKIENPQEYIKAKLEKHKNQRNKYQNLLEQLSGSDETQISTSDHDSRNLPIKQQFTEVSYSIQASADAKNKILLDFEVTNKTDKAALLNSVNRAAEVLETNDFVGLYDKGYFSAAQIAKCQELGVTVLVSPPPRPNANPVPTPMYHGNKFTYNKQTDTYLCPDNQILTSNGKIYKSPHGEFKQYKTEACIPCKSLKNCTTSKQGIRLIERSQYAENAELNNQLVKSNSQLYRLRQEIIEHPFGTIKRQWGFDHTVMKRGKEHVSSDIGLIFIAYNLRRLINLLIKNQKTSKNSTNLLLNLNKILQKFLNSFRFALNFKAEYFQKNISN